MNAENVPEVSSVNCDSSNVPKNDNNNNIDNDSNNDIDNNNDSNNIDNDNNNIIDNHNNNKKKKNNNDIDKEINGNTQHDNLMIIEVNQNYRIDINIDNNIQGTESADLQSDNLKKSDGERFTIKNTFTFTSLYIFQITINNQNLRNKMKKDR